MNIPVIKLEVESMKYTVVTALQQHAALMDSSIQAAVDFGRWNENGRIAVREAVIAFLDERYPVKQVGE